MLSKRIITYLLLSQIWLDIEQKVYVKSGHLPGNLSNFTEKDLMSEEFLHQFFPQYLDQESDSEIDEDLDNKKTDALESSVLMNNSGRLKLESNESNTDSPVTIRNIVANGTIIRNNNTSGDLMDSLVKLDEIIYGENKTGGSMEKLLDENSSINFTNSRKNNNRI